MMCVMSSEKAVAASEQSPRPWRQKPGSQQKAS
jgi:hypothetical protein